MKREKIEGSTRQSGGPANGRRNGGPAAGETDSVGRREHLLEALRECYGIANGEAEHRVREFEAHSDRASEFESGPVAALLRPPMR